MRKLLLCLLMVGCSSVPCFSHRTQVSENYWVARCSGSIAGCIREMKKTCDTPHPVKVGLGKEFNSWLVIYECK